MQLHQCMECGSDGWKIYELKNGLCPSCQDEEAYFNDEDYFDED